MNLSELQEFLNKGMVSVKTKENTLFDIAGFPHYENVVSNIYAYLFDPARDHNLGNLFLESLQELSRMKFTVSEPQIWREFFTNSGKRIDLVLYEKFQDTANDTSTEPRDEWEYAKVSKNVIIIENKVFHQANNDFDDYYNTFSSENKQGILLTLRPISCPHNGFVNITHNQLVDHALKKLGPLLLSVPERTLFILKEFGKNLKNHTMEIEAKKYFKFYDTNRAQIESINRLQDELDKHIWDQINIVPQLLKDLGLHTTSMGSGRLRYYETDKTDCVFFTVFPVVFGAGKSTIEIVIELGYAGISRKDEIKEIDFTDEEKALFKEKEFTRAGWHHFASYKFELREDMIENLGQYIADKIETTELKSIFLKLQAEYCKRDVVGIRIK